MAAEGITAGLNIANYDTQRIQRLFDFTEYLNERMSKEKN